MFGWGNPKWFKMLPEVLRPEKSQVHLIEHYRQRLGYGHDEMAIAIAGSDWGTRRTQAFAYSALKAQNPRITESEAIQRLLLRQIELARAAGSALSMEELENLHRAVSVEDFIERLVVMRREAEPAIDGSQEIVDDLLRIGQAAF